MELESSMKSGLNLNMGLTAVLLKEQKIKRDTKLERWFELHSDIKITIKYVLSIIIKVISENIFILYTLSHSKHYFNCTEP